MQMLRRMLRRKPSRIGGKLTYEDERNTCSGNRRLSELYTKDRAAGYQMGYDEVAKEDCNTYQGLMMVTLCSVSTGSLKMVPPGISSPSLMFDAMMIA